MWAGLGGGGRWHVVIGGDQELPRHLGNVMKMFCFLGNYEERSRSDTPTPLELPLYSSPDTKKAIAAPQYLRRARRMDGRRGGGNKITLLFPTAISHPQNRHFFVPGRSTTSFPPLYIRATHIRTAPVRRGSCTQAGRGGQSSMHHPHTHACSTLHCFFALEKNEVAPFLDIFC